MQCNSLLHWPPLKKRPATDMCEIIGYFVRKIIIILNLVENIIEKVIHRVI